MRVGYRPWGRTLLAPFAPKHWRAILFTFATCRAPIEALVRYVTARGVYPWTLTIRTPTGPLPVTVDEHQDLLTVNEIFFRRDYGSSKHATVVDVGANAGYATLFFASRRRDCRVWSVEPEPETAARLRRNTATFADRVTVIEAAATVDDGGPLTFVHGWHSRYGHLAQEGEAGISVNRVTIRALVERVVAETGAPVDLVKIDTEGGESELADAIPPELSREIRYEMPDRIEVRRH